MNRIIPLAIALALAGCGDNPEARLERATTAFAAHDYRAAQIDVAAALQAQPDNVAALELAVRNQLAQGDGIAAQAALDRLARLGRSPSDARVLGAESALLRGKPKEALALAEGQGGAEAHRLRGLARFALGDAAAAEREFEAGLKAGGDGSRLLADYARFKLGRGDLAGAEALSARALNAAPDGLDPLLAGAQVATAQGDLAGALKRYDRAAAVYPGNLAALTGKAATLGDLGRKKEFAALLGELEKTAPGEPAVAYLQARAAAQAEDWAKVRATLQPHEAALAARDDAMVLYAQAQLGLGQAEQVRARLEPIVRRAPGNAIAALTLARAQLDGGDAKAAAATLRSRATQPEAPGEVLALMARATRAAGDPEAPRFAERARYPTPQALGAALAGGDAALRAGNWQAAAEAYRRILAQTDGRNALVLNNLAFAEGKLGNTAVALRHAEKALKLAPSDASVMDTAGWLLVASGGDRNRALDLLRAAARKAPGNATIAAHLAAAEKGA